MLRDCVSRISTRPQFRWEKIILTGRGAPLLGYTVDTDADFYVYDRVVLFAVYDDHWEASLRPDVINITRGMWARFLASSWEMRSDFTVETTKGTLTVRSNDVRSIAIFLTLLTNPPNNRIYKDYVLAEDIVDNTVGWTTPSFGVYPWIVCRDRKTAGLCCYYGRILVNDREEITPIEIPGVDSISFPDAPTILTPEEISTLTQRNNFWVDEKNAIRCIPGNKHSIVSVFSSIRLLLSLRSVAKEELWNIQDDLPGASSYSQPWENTRRMMFYGRLPETFFNTGGFLNVYNGG